MLSSRCHAISALGLSDREWCVIKSICALSVGRPQVYHLVDPESAQILVVNADDPRALQAAAALDPDNSPLKVYLNGEGRASGSSPLKRPVHPASLLKVLEKMSSVIVQRAADATESAFRLLEASATRAPAFRALVVDESPAMRRQMDWVLSEFGGVADGEASGEQALAALLEGSYDLVFIDSALPGVDGYQICKSIKRNPRHKGLPVILLTHRATPFDKMRGSFAGCDAHLSKSAEVQDLRRVVQRWVPQSLAAGCA